MQILSITHSNGMFKATGTKVSDVADSALMSTIKKLSVQDVRAGLEIIGAIEGLLWGGEGDQLVARAPYMGWDEIAVCLMENAIQSIAVVISDVRNIISTEGGGKDKIRALLLGDISCVDEPSLQPAAC